MTARLPRYAVDAIDLIQIRLLSVYFYDEIKLCADDRNADELRQITVLYERLDRVDGSA